MTYQPFKDLDQKLETYFKQREQQTGENKMVSESKTKTRSTKAHVTQAVKKAKAYMKAHPTTPQAKVAEIVGIAVPTLARHLAKKRTYQKRTTLDNLPSNKTAEHDAIKNYIEAKQSFETAREVLLTLLGEK